MAGEDIPPEAARATLDYLIRELIVDVRALGARLERIESSQASGLEAMQRMIAFGVRQKQHGRRIAKLEGVVYENQERPVMQGPPEHRRPILPARSDEDSGIHDFSLLNVEIEKLRQYKEKQERRDSFLEKKKWSALYSVLAALAIAAITSSVTWLVAHVAMRP
jgi:hypothetical protein